ncbi:MAG: hypothetical protein K6G20_12400 [Ruminococcus sp.]|nr:hypothetical protein [Ruminococcus sp.]
MIKTNIEILIEKLKSGEKVTCQKCKKGLVVYEHKEGHKFPDIYCDNPNCKAKVIFN